MKLLFDQNISFRLPQKIAAFFPDAKQVRGLSLENSTDMAIWTFAKDHNYAIVTFDSDFYDLSTYFGHPPKIIWLRTGNTQTENLAELINNKTSLIKDFLTNDAYKDLACIQID